MSVTVVVVEDHEMVATAFREALDGDDRIEVAAVAHDLDAGVTAVRESRPTVVVVDLRLGGVEVAEHLGLLREAHPATRLLVVTGWATERTLFACLDNGADGFLAKTQPMQEFLDAVVQVADGETVVAPHLVPALVRRTSGHRGREPGRLTAREAEVLQHLSAGTGTTAIAEALGVSPNTVRNHVSALMTKLGARTRLEAVNRARQLDLIAPTPSS